MGVIYINTLNINSQSFILDNDIENGFFKGSLWENLYSPYKYKVTSLKFDNDYNRAIYMLQVYTFASVELALYIATHPNCNEAFETLKKINAQKQKICDFIETKYTAITSSSEILNGYFDLAMPWSEKYVGI